MPFDIASRQILGTRSHQEDDFAVAEFYGGALLILADGMGGHAGGDVAASLAVERFGAAFRQADSQNVAVRLERGLDTANAAIADRIAEDLNLEGMGCTVVGVWMVADQLGFISVGDSPLWCLRASGFDRLNEDHSMAGLMEEAGDDLSDPASRLAYTKARNMLRSSVQGEAIDLVDRRDRIAMAAGDMIVLASDGILTLDVDEIAPLAESLAGRDSETVAATLIGAVVARDNPRQDNATIIVGQALLPA